MLPANEWPAAEEAVEAELPKVTEGPPVSGDLWSGVRDVVTLPVFQVVMEMAVLVSAEIMFKVRYSAT